MKIFIDESPPYFATSKGQNCLESETVSTEEECITASEKIGREYVGRTTSKKRPAGCYWVITSLSNTDYPNSYFNTILEAHSVDLMIGREHGGICQTMKTRSHTG